MHATQTHAQPLVCAPGLVASAVNAGWLNPLLCEPGEYLGGICSLPLGASVVPVRFVENRPGVERLFDGIAGEIAAGLCLENYIVLGDGFAPEHIGSVRASVQRAGRRVHVGNRDDYEQWVASRLGPIGQLDASTPMRQFLERFLQYSGRPLPTKKYPWNVHYKKGNSIEKSFHLGALGSQAIWTLFAYGIGVGFIDNVECNPFYQPKGIDFLFQSALGCRFGRVISADLKNEKIFRWGLPTRNLALELYSNLEENKIGWFLNEKTAMDLLISLNWLTADAWVVSFPQLRSWYLAGGGKGLETRRGKAEGQKYHSEVALLPVDKLFGEFNGDAFHFNLKDWIGNAYMEKEDREFETFTYPSVMPSQYSSRTLVPQI